MEVCSLMNFELSRYFELIPICIAEIKLFAEQCNGRGCKTKNIAINIEKSAQVLSELQEGHPAEQIIMQLI